MGAVGLDESAQHLAADGRLRVAPGVWAAGDIVGRGAFTHMSTYHAGIVTADILGQPVHEAEYHAVPRVTFTDPEIGSAGLSERQARDRGLDIRVATSSIPESTRGWIYKAGNDGFIKLLWPGLAGRRPGLRRPGPAAQPRRATRTLATFTSMPRWPVI